MLLKKFLEKITSSSSSSSSATPRSAQNLSDEQSSQSSQSAACSSGSDRQNQPRSEPPLSKRPRNAASAPNHSGNAPNSHLLPPPPRSSTTADPLASSASHSNMQSRETNPLECFYTSSHLNTNSNNNHHHNHHHNHNHHHHHSRNPVTFNLSNEDDNGPARHAHNEHNTNNATHGHRVNREIADCRMNSSNSLHLRHEDENDHHDEDHNEQGSSQSSFSGNMNRLENDIEDLHLHHDHNTQFLFKNGNHSCKLMDSLNEMRKSKQLCDITLVVDGEEIHCHKSIIACNSPYFMAMFSNDLMESNSKRVELKEVDATSLTLVIEYMYTGELLITECNVQSLLITANLLGMGNVKDSCGQFIQSQIDVTNCLGIYEFADYHCAKVLEKHADAFIEQYFSDIVQKEEFLSLNVDQIIKLISKDHLAVHSEKIVFDCVLKWINHDYEKRHSFLAKLMENVRFCLLKHDDLVQISEDPLVKANILCMEFIVEALQFKMIKSNSAELLKFEANFSKKSRLKPRVPLGLPKIMFVFGGQAPKAISKIDVYDFRSQEWHEHDDMPTKRCRAGCVYHDGLIYLIGGFNGQSRIRSIDIYDSHTEIWSQGPDMLCRRGTLGVGILNDKVYAVGGFDGMTGLVSVECWSMKPNESWTMVAPLSTRRSSVGIAVVNNYLYAIGGYCGLSRECLDSVERYDPFSDVWSPVAHMTTRRSGACVNVYDGKVYVVGGHDGPHVLKSVEMYDPTSNRWTLISELNVARRNAGGDDGHTNLSSVEIFNPQRNVWSLLSSFLTEAKSYTSCIIIENYA